MPGNLSFASNNLLHRLISQHLTEDKDASMSKGFQQVGHLSAVIGSHLWSLIEDHKKSLSADVLMLKEAIENSDKATQVGTSCCLSVTS